MNLLNEKQKKIGLFLSIPSLILSFGSGLAADSIALSFIILGILGIVVGAIIIANNEE
jgi:hypothetical protein